MSPWLPKAIVLVASVALVVIPHIQHRRGGSLEKVVSRRRRPLELVLLTLVSLGFVLPLVWAALPVLAFADYPLRPIPFIAGILCLAIALTLLYRSHADLGTNWSVTLAVRAQHRLVTHGVYRLVRHPMYLALLLYASGLALVLPNWLAGLWYGGAMALLVAVRMGPEEQMMLDAFGKDYERYMARTRRLIPGLW